MRAGHHRTAASVQLCAHEQANAPAWQSGALQALATGGEAAFLQSTALLEVEWVDFAPELLENPGNRW
jgi:hypothetical protein